MEYVVIYIIIVNSLWLDYCYPKKRKIPTIPGISPKQVTQEWEHYRDYVSNPDGYLNWPELDRHKTKEICECYLRKIFLKKDVTVKGPVITQIEILYREVKDENANEVSVPVAALQCKLSAPGRRRLYFDFSRATTLDCMYLLNSYYKRLTTTFYVAAKICNHHTNATLKKNGDLTQDIVRTSHKSTRKDLLEKQKEYEKKHMENYLHVPDFHNNWVELQNEDIRHKYCRMFFKKIYPQTNLGDVKTSYDLLMLRYARIRTVENQEYYPVQVAALTCKTLQRFARFVKAPDPKCVYLVRKFQAMTEISPHYNLIVRYICDQKIGQNVLEYTPQQQHKEGSTNNQPENNNEEQEYESNKGQDLQAQHKEDIIPNQTDNSQEEWKCTQNESEQIVKLQDKKLEIHKEPDIGNEEWLHVQNETEQVSESQHQESEIVNQASNDTEVWEWDFPIDDGPLVLEWI